MVTNDRKLKSTTRLNFEDNLKHFTWLHSKTRPLRPSEAILVPTVLETKVFPTWRQLNMLGALTSYQSFLVKGSMLKLKIYNKYYIFNGKFKLWNLGKCWAVNKRYTHWSKCIFRYLHLWFSIYKMKQHGHRMPYCCAEMHDSLSIIKDTAHDWW